MNASLIDPHGRPVDYLRLSVTDRCDLRCQYCLPAGYRDFEEPEHWLTFDEIERLVRAFTELGVRRVRLTGGEPLTRRGLPGLARRLSALPHLEDLSLSTNAIQLGRDAVALREAGVRRLNVSLDSLRADRYAAITGGGKLEKVRHGLETARRAGFSPIKINMVVMGGVNDDEIGDMVRFCIDREFTLRFIETMPIGDTGREASHHYVDLQTVRQRLEQEFTLLPAAMTGGGPARYFRVADTELRIGFITPISQHFCDTCNRVRLAADGTLYLCLGQEDNVQFRPLMRSGANTETLKEMIRAGIARKPEKHEFREAPAKVVRFMAQTGG